MSSPSGWVKSKPEPPRSRGCQYPFNATSQPRCRFCFGAPNGGQDSQDMVSFDFIKRQVANDWISVLFNRVGPLVGVFGIRPLGLLGGNAF